MSGESDSAHRRITFCAQSTPGSSLVGRWWGAAACPLLAPAGRSLVSFRSLSSPHCHQQRTPTCITFRGSLARTRLTCPARLRARIYTRARTSDQEIIKFARCTLHEQPSRPFARNATNTSERKRPRHRWDYWKKMTVKKTVRALSGP